jgi:hypothetical protein
MPEGHLKLPQSLNEARPALARWVAALGLVTVEDQAIAILCAGLLVHLILPWAVLALCRILGIDIPDWSLFVLFSAPAALSLCAAVTFAAVHARHSHGQGVPENAASADLMSFPILGSAGFGRSARMR